MLALSADRRRGAVRHEEAVSILSHEPADRGGVFGVRDHGDIETDAGAVAAGRWFHRQDLVFHRDLEVPLEAGPEHDADGRLHAMFGWQRDPQSAAVGPNGERGA